MDSNSNDRSNVKVPSAAAVARFSAGPLHRAHHSGHRNVDDITSACTHYSPTSTHEALSSRAPRRPEPVYLSPRHHSSPPTSSSVTLNECCAPAPLSAQARPLKKKMGLSKTQRIGILLGIDSAFFLVELIVGKWELSQIEAED